MNDIYSNTSVASDPGSKSPDQKAICQEILENFSYEHPSESVYKIIGPKGLGKTSLLANIKQALQSQENRQKGWLVFELDPKKDLLEQFASKLDQQGFGKNRNNPEEIFQEQACDLDLDIGVKIKGLLEQVQKENKKILIELDDIAKNQKMIEFISEFALWLRADYPIYLICTGLPQEFKKLYDEKNLGFFIRGVTIKLAQDQKES